MLLLEEETFRIKKRFDFQRQRKIYGVDSVIALKTWIFQNHQNIAK